MRLLSYFTDEETETQRLKVYNQYISKLNLKSKRNKTLEGENSSSDSLKYFQSVESLLPGVSSIWLK